MKILVDKMPTKPCECLFVNYKLPVFYGINITIDDDDLIDYKCSLDSETCKVNCDGCSKLKEIK